MNTTTKIRAAYLRQHQHEQFSLNIAGNLRPLLANPQTTNAALYSGEPARLVGGALAYWKFEDGFFVVCGALQEIRYLNDNVLPTYEVFKIDMGGVEVISLRERVEKREARPDYLAAGNVDIMLTAFDKAVEVINDR